ncbi:MAG: TetR/AcrR family transcriptional regulator [Acidobacteriaceae bacterium]
MTPISDCEVRDPRIRRTRGLLQDALRKLMLQKSFDEISVQDIAELATVNRATFYDHYTDKYALLEALVGSGFHQFLAQRQVSYSAGCPGAVSAIILATCDFLTQAHSTGSCDHQTAFEPLMDAAITKAIRRILLAGMGDVESLPPTAVLVAATVSASICAGVKQWLAMPDRPPSEALVVQLQPLVMPMLDGGLSAPAQVSHREWLADPAK